MDINPLFIIGSPRSGTTLLAELLEPSNYGAPFESHFITKYYKLLAQYGDLNQKDNFIRLVKDITGERYIAQWKLKINPEDLYHKSMPFDFQVLANNLCMLHSQKYGYVSWGDKTPHYTLDVDVLCRLFPKAKFIMTVRDGRDIALSLLREPWGPNNFYSCAALYCQYYKDTEALRRLKQEGRIVFVKYEELLDAPEEVMRGVYRFLGEGYPETSLSSKMKTIKRTNKNKWRQKMTPGQLRVFESVAADTLSAQGYQTSGAVKPLNFALRGAYLLHEQCMRLVFLFRLNVIDGIKIRFFSKEPFAE